MATVVAAPVPPRQRRWPTSVVVTVLCLCGTVVSLQQTLVIPLLPDFPHILDTSADNTSWLVTVTLLTSAVSTPIVSRLADMFGKRRMMVLCLAMMICGSVVAALGAAFALVVTGRALQGFAVALIPVGISILRDELPREKVPSAVALMSATLGIGSAVGLPMSGIIYAHWGWHAIFWVCAVAGALLVTAVVVVVPESAVRTRGRFDYLGAVLLSIALTSLLLALSKGGHWGWVTERTVGLFMLAAVAFVVWLRVELGASQPLVDIRTSTRKPVLLTNIASILLGFAMYGNMLTTTQQLQMPKISGYGFGTSVVVAGACMLPGGLAMVLLAPVSATITKQFGARTTLIVGALVIAGGYVARVNLTATIWQVVLGATLVSMGTAIAYAAMPTLIMRSVPITETASANGLNTLLRAIGTSVSSSVVAAILTSVTITVAGVVFPSLAAFQHIFWLCAFAALIGAGVALALPSRAALARAAREARAGRPAAPDGDIKGPGTEREIVVRGIVTRGDQTPIKQAVVSVLTTVGESVDWARADNDGCYSVVLPGPGRYVVVSSAEGWAPKSEIIEFGADSGQQRVELKELLSLAGVVTLDGRPLSGALVSLTRITGEPMRSVHTGADGRYEMPLPPSGRYILTLVDPDAAWAQSRQVVVLAYQSATINVDIGADLLRVDHRPATEQPEPSGHQARH